MFTSIVVAFDGSPHATRALETAASLAVENKASLGIIHVIEPSHMTIPDGVERMAEVEHVIKPAPKLLVNLENMPAEVASSLTKAAAESQRVTFQLANFMVERAKDDASKAGAEDITTEVLIGNPAEEILSFASSRKADLIVIGSRGFGKLKSLLLGSTSHKVTQHAECSCLTVK
jgi:nucleotide-binding universal stress UspA family protein